MGLAKLLKGDDQPPDSYEDSSTEAGSSDMWPPAVSDECSDPGDQSGGSARLEATAASGPGRRAAPAAAQASQGAPATRANCGGAGAARALKVQSAAPLAQQRRTHQRAPGRA